MKKLSWKEFIELLVNSEGQLVISLNYWRNTLASDSEIFGCIEGGYICEGPIVSEDISVGFFSVEKSLRQREFLERIARNQLVKLFAANVSQEFYSSLSPTIFAELLEVGEFSEKAISDGGKITGCDWVVLSDQNEYDEPYYFYRLASQDG